MKITFKRFGTEITKEFENRNDLIEFVILSGIKDEELVSIDLFGDTITDGIDGLARYTLNKIAEDRKADEEACNCDCEDCDCECCDCDDCDFDDEDDDVSMDWEDEDLGN